MTFNGVGIEITPDTTVCEAYQAWIDAGESSRT
jgi:hypothetical protein